MNEYKLIRNFRFGSNSKKYSEKKVRSYNKKEITMSLMDKIRWRSPKRKRTPQDKEALSMISSMRFVTRMVNRGKPFGDDYIGRSYVRCLTYAEKLNDSSFVNGLSKHIKRLFTDTAEKFTDTFKKK